MSLGRIRGFLLLSFFITIASVSAQNNQRVIPSQIGSFLQAPFLHSGEWGITSVDLIVKGRGFDFVFARRYESQALYDGPLGNGWDHLYFMRLQELPNGDIFFYDGRGRKELFRVLPPPPLPGPLLYVSPPEQIAELKKLQDGRFLIHQPDGMAYLFNNYGQLERIQDRNENYMEFFYNPVGQLSVVTDTMGRTISYHYNDDQKLVKVRDFDGREWKFKYDEGITSSDPKRKPNFLTSVTTTAVTDTSNGNDFPDGKTTKYQYHLGDDLPMRANLTKVTNPRGEVFIENKYNDQDQLVEQIYGQDKITFAYEAGKTTVTDRNGNEIVYEFNKYGNPTAITRGGFTTRMEYDPDIIIPDLPLIPSDGLLTKITFAEGNSIEYTYEKSMLSRLLRRRSEANLISVKQIPGPRGTGGSSETLTASYTYDPLYNQVLTATDPKGNVTTHEQDQHGNATKITMPEGVTQSFTYNKYGQILTETFGEGNSNTYEYFPEAHGGNSVRNNPDQQTGGYLKKKTVGGLFSNSFVYDDLGRMTEFTDGNNVKSSYKVNALDQIIKESRFDPLSFETIYEYDANDNLVKKLPEHSSAGGDGFSEQRFEHNHPLNYLTAESSETDPDVFATTSYQYDANGNRELVTLPEGNQVKYEYDARDLNTSTTRGFGSADASASTFGYDGNGNLISSTDGEQHTREALFDGYNRQIRIKDALSNLTESLYDNSSNLTNQTRKDAQGTVLAATAQVYDGLNRVKSRAEKFSPEDAVSAYVYDLNSRISKITDANSHETNYGYDAANRIASLTDAAGNSTAYEYDGNGNTTKSTESETGLLGSESFVTVNEYDQANRLTKTTDPAGEAMEYVYDSQGNQVITIDGEGNQTATAYDNANQRIKTEEGNGQIVTGYKYDLNNRLAEITDDNLNRTVFAHDALDRNFKTIYPDGKEIVLGFDRIGNVETAIDPNGTTIGNTYDALNRLTARSITKAPGVEGAASETFEYDGLSRLTKAIDDDSVVEFGYDTLSNVTSEKQDGKTVTSKYDGVGNRTEINYPSGRQLALQYDQTNRLNQIAEGGNAITAYDYQGAYRTAKAHMNGGTLQTDFAYDADRRVIAIQHKTSTNALIAGYGYAWNKANQRKYEQRLHENGRADVYSYDSIYRLTQVAIDALDPNSTASASKVISYNQDGVHNYRQITEMQLGVSNTKTTQVNSRNQYTVFDGQPLSYDENGNTKTLFGKQLFSDYANRLTRVVNSDGTTTTMKYDALGRRTEVAVNGQATNYVWSGQQTLEEYNGAALSASYVYSRGIDEIVHMKRGGQDYYYHLNSIGSVKAITDSTGRIVEAYDYDNYGKRTIHADSTPPEVEQVRLKSGDLHVRFTEAIRRESFTATIHDSGNAEVQFTTSFEEEDRKVILYPAVPFAAAAYTLTIQAGLADINLNKTAGAFQQAFTVAGDAIYFDGKPPQVERISIAAGTRITIQFQEELAEVPATAIELSTNSQVLAGSASFTSGSREVDYILNERAPPGTYTIALSSAIKDQANQPLSAFQRILVIASDDQVLYQNQPDVIASSSIGNTIGFQGRVVDESTGLIYFRARYLDSTTNRFLSPDPFLFADSPNHYSAFLNNGLNLRDALGREVENDRPEGRFYNRLNGIQAHQVFFRQYINVRFPFLSTDTEIRRLEPESRSKDRPDVAYFARKHIWELKPVTHNRSPYKRGEDATQVIRYLTELQQYDPRWKGGNPSFIVKHTPGGEPIGFIIDINGSGPLEVRIYPDQNPEYLKYGFVFYRLVPKDKDKRRKAAEEELQLEESFENYFERQYPGLKDEHRFIPLFELQRIPLWVRLVA